MNILQSTKTKTLLFINLSILTLFFFAFPASTAFAQGGFFGRETYSFKERRSNFVTPDEGLSDANLRTPKFSNQNRLPQAGNIFDPTFNVSVTEGSGYVYETAVQTDGKIVAVGLFQRADGVRTNNITRYNADGTLDSSFNPGTGANLVIRAVALQTDGKIIIAGSFTTFNQQTVSRIVRLNSDGSIDPSFNTQVVFNNTINDVTVQPDGKILVGGAFTLSSSKLIRLNGDGTVDIAFSGFNTTVYKIVFTADGKILVGGNSGSLRGIKRINADGTSDTSFDPGTGTNSAVFDIAIQPDGKIILGGTFETYNQIPTDSIVRINNDGSLDTAYAIPEVPPSLYIEVDALTIQDDGKLLVSYYWQSDTSNINKVIRFNNNGTQDTTFNTGETKTFQVLDINKLADGNLLLGGGFVEYNNQSHLRLVKIHPDGTLDNAFNPSASTAGMVYNIKRQSDGKILIAGDFSFVNGIRNNGIARLNVDGTLDNTFNSGSGISGIIYSILIQSDGKIVIGGNFFGYDNNFTASFARINVNGSFDINLNDYSSNFAIFYIYALESQPDGKILAGGLIYNADFNPVSLIRLNPNGTTDASFFPPITNSSTLGILIQPDGKIIFGGAFTSLGGTGIPRNGIARLNSNGTLDSGFSSNFGSVYSLARQPDGKIIAGGSSLIRYFADGTVDSTFNTGVFSVSSIRALAIQSDGKIIVGGFFTPTVNLPANKIVRVNSDGSLDTTFNSGSGTSGSVSALAVQPDGKILVGGQFLDFNGSDKFSLVRLQDSTRSALFDFDGDGKSDISVFRPSNSVWYLNQSTNGFTGVTFGFGTDLLAPADYDGDGKTDLAVFRSGTWYIQRSTAGFIGVAFGANGDLPRPGDFDGDGKADINVFRPSNGAWYRLNSSNGAFVGLQFGQNGDTPLIADFDGDGKSDIAVFRPSAAIFYYLESVTGQFKATQFGLTSDIPTPGDYDGDGKTDIAVFRPSNGNWYRYNSSTGAFVGLQFGQNGDVPVAADYDGDGKTDIAVFRPSNGAWYYLKSSNGGFAGLTFGVGSDVAIPSVFH